MVGLINEIAGENGMAWNARILMFHATVDALGPDALTTRCTLNTDMIRTQLIQAEKIESFFELSCFPYGSAAMWAPISWSVSV